MCWLGYLCVFMQFHTHERPPDYCFGSVAVAVVVVHAGHGVCSGRPHKSQQAILGGADEGSDGGGCAHTAPQVGKRKKIEWSSSRRPTRHIYFFQVFLIPSPEALLSCVCVFFLVFVHRNCGLCFRFMVFVVASEGSDGGGCALTHCRRWRETRKTIHASDRCDK